MLCCILPTFYMFCPRNGDSALGPCLICPWCNSDRCSLKKIIQGKIPLVSSYLAYISMRCAPYVLAQGTREQSYLLL